MAPEAQLYDEDTRETSKMRAKILKALQAAGVSDADTERLVTFYAQEIQQIHVPPPPLPPRSSEPDSESAHVPDGSPPFHPAAQSFAPLSNQPTSKPIPTTPTFPPTEKAGKLAPGYRFLIVDHSNIDRSIIAHGYLEYLRIWTANNGGPWIFDEVQSAGLYISTPFRLSATGRLSSDADRPLVTARRMNPPRLTANTLFGPREPPSDHESPNEVCIIDKSLRRHESRGIHGSDFWHFDYILAWSSTRVELLEELQRKAQTTKLSHSQDRDGRKARIVHLPDADFGHVEEVQKSVRHFLGTEFGWSLPEHAWNEGQYRTKFVLVKLRKHLKWPDHAEDEWSRAVVGDSGCQLYMSGHLSWIPSEENARTVAIVGPKGALAPVKRSLDQLLKDRDVGSVNPGYYVRKRKSHATESAA